MINEIGTGLEIYELAKKQGWIDKLRYYLRKKHTVIVLGSTGSGKTNFLESLSTDLPAAIDRLNRTDYAQRHKLKIAENPFIFCDTPGQLGHKSRRERAIRESIGKGKVGVINVVCSGFHEYRAGKADAISTNCEPKTQWLKRHRAIEIDAMSEWLPLLGSRDTTDWLLTVCTKADLWWHDHEDVLQHYESGPYHKALGSPLELDVAVAPYCSVIKRFFNDGFVSREFDEQLRLKLRTHLLSTIIQAIGRSTLNAN